MSLRSFDFSSRHSRESGLRRQDAEANIRAADGPRASRGRGESIQFFAFFSRIKMDSRFRGNDVLLAVVL
jgi:hypothetical protein